MGHLVDRNRESRMVGFKKPYVGIEEDWKNGQWKKSLKALLAEFLGTMILVLVACGACTKHEMVSDGGGGKKEVLDVVRIALAFGLTVATMAQSIGHISGCHINPGVTAGLMAGGKIGLINGLLYIVVQTVGAIVGAALLLVLTGQLKSDSPSIGAVGLNADGPVSAGAGFGIEFFITFVLVLVVYAAAADENNAGSVKGSAPLAIGFAISIGHLFAVPLTGAGMNPARSLGTAIVASKLEHHWVYWIGPLLGGIFAGLLYQLVFQAPEQTNKEQPEDGEKTELVEVKGSESATASIK